MSQFDTALSPSDEAQYAIWKKKYAPSDSGADYDLRGAFKAGLQPDPQTGHWPDTFKKPNHPTFSNESQYATGGYASKAGHWQGDQFIPPDSPMSAIAPDQKAIVAELLKRRDTLTPDKQAVVDELGKRFGLSEAADPNAAVLAAQKAKFPTAAEGGDPNLPWYAGYFGGGQQQPAPEPKTLGDTTLGALTVGVDPSRFLERIGGAAASVINPLLPAGDTRRPSAQLPAMTPDQEIGAKTMAVAPIAEGAITGSGALFNKLKSAIPMPSADSLMRRAAANRAPLPPLTPADVARDALTTGVGAAVGGPPGAAAVEGANLLRRTNLYRGGKASIQEGIARRMTAGNTAPESFSGTTEPDLDYLAGQAEKRRFLAEDAEAAREAEIKKDLFSQLKRPSNEPRAEIPMANPPNLSVTPQSAADEMRRSYQMGNAQVEHPAAQPYTAPAQPKPSTLLNDAFLEDVRAGRLSGEPNSVTAADVNKWMGTSPKEVARGANPGQQLLEENLLGANKAETQANVARALDNAGKAMESHLKAATAKGVTIDAQTPVYDAVANAKKALGAPRTDAAFNAQMDGLVDDIEGRFSGLDKLTPEATHELKVWVGDAIQWSGAGYDTPVNKALVSIYRDLNGAIKSGVEGIGPAQARWGNLYIASRNLKGAIAKEIVGKGTGNAPTAAKTLFDRMKAH